MAYIVNQGGVTTQIPDEMWVQIQREPGPYIGGVGHLNHMREATVEEITAYWKAQGFIYDPKTGDAHKA